MLKVFITFALVMLCALPARAEGTPVPGKKVSLQSLEEKLAREKSSRDALEKEVAKAKDELEDTRKNLVTLADKIRGNESEISRLEKRIVTLGAEEAELTKKLEADYGSIGNLILALERLRRIPPESLLARPGAPLETAQSAMLLQSVLPAIHGRAEKLSADLNRLTDLREGLVKDSAALQETREKLGLERTGLAALVDKREDLLKSTQDDYEQSRKSVERISKDATNLRDLMARLEEEETARLRARTAAAASAGKPKPRPVPIPKAGSSRLPAAGMIAVGYGETDNIGAKSQGLTIETGASAIVVSPMGGVVKFAGTFKNYGQMVIVEHESGYHSLIAGLSRIEANTGQALIAGEPVGRMPSASSSGGQPTLYYELRHKGQPVNPATKFGNLGT